MRSRCVGRLVERPNMNVSSGARVPSPAVSSSSPRSPTTLVFTLSTEHQEHIRHNLLIFLFRVNFCFVVTGTIADGSHVYKKLD